MERNPQQWVYSALVGMSLLLAGWLWQIVGTLRDDIHRMQDTKADKPATADRWTGSQQVEYMKYVETRFAAVTDEIRRYHSKEGKQICQ